MSWSVRLWLAAFAASLNLVACGANQRLPTVRAVADNQFMHRARTVRSVDVLPVDFQMWTYGGNQEKPSVIRQRFDALTGAALSNNLASRGYNVAANIGWDGAYAGPSGEARSAMQPRAVQQTIYALSGYGRAVRRARRGLLIPHLPHRLGTATGSDATLYVGGWSYVGVDPVRKSGGNKVAKGLLIGLFAVVIVVAVIASIKGKGGGVGKVASGAGKAAAGVAKGAVKAVGKAVRATPRMTGRAMGRVANGVARVAHGVSRSSIQIDAWGRTHTHVDVYNGRPDYFQYDRVPRKGRSKMLVEMTLVDNRTGLVLWHARQHFRVSGSRPAQVTRVVDRMLASLPAAPGGPGQ